MEGVLLFILLTFLCSCLVIDLWIYYFVWLKRIRSLENRVALLEEEEL